MNAALTIAKKEITDALKNKIFIIILVMLLALTAVSIILGSYQVRASVDEYNKSVEFLKSIGKTDFPPMPNLNPISASKNFVNYIGMLGALLAIILGNNAIASERRNGTLKLILSRKVFRDVFLNGKLMGNLTLLFATTVLSAVITFASLTLIGSVSLTGAETVRMLLFFLMSFLFMAFFLVLGIAFAVFIGNGNKALLLTVIIWLILAFVFPQIGDTMDMDNQLPGGFFAQMGMTRQQETEVLQQFKFYETLRDSIEELSPTKHYERVSFALLNVKPGFENNTPMEVMGLKWVNLIGLAAPSIILWFIAYMVFLRREDIYQN
jgi:ABC-2 type transport system permease protein